LRCALSRDSVLSERGPTPPPLAKSRLPIRRLRIWQSDQFRVLLFLGLASRTRRSSSVIFRLTMSKNIRSMRVLVLRNPSLVFFKSRPSFISARRVASFHKRQPHLRRELPDRRFWRRPRLFRRIGLPSPRGDCDLQSAGRSVSHAVSS
jgi:hypothetical protein